VPKGSKVVVVVAFAVTITIYLVPILIYSHQMRGTP
jgi:hypothetical protein